MGSFLFSKRFAKLTHRIMKERQLAQMVEQQINLSVVGSSPTLFLFYFLESHLVSERRYFMLTKKEKKALDLLLRMKGSRNFIEFVYDSILLNRVKMMGLSPYALMHKVAIKEE